MFCPKCGKNVDTPFCTVCGLKMPRRERPTEPEQPPEPNPFIGGYEVQCKGCERDVSTLYCGFCGERSMSVASLFDIFDGEEFEAYCAHMLPLNGFINISITKGSFDFGVDLLAEKDGVTYAIQCKCYSSSVGGSAVQEVVAGKQYYERDIGIVMTNSYFTPSAQKLADSTMVKLWDGRKLMALEETALAKQRKRQ